MNSLLCGCLVLLAFVCASDSCNKNLQNASNASKNLYQSAIQNGVFDVLKGAFHDQLEKALKALPNTCGASLDPTDTQICPGDLRPECQPMFALAAQKEVLASRRQCKNKFPGVDQRACKMKCTLSVLQLVVDGKPNTDRVQQGAARLNNPITTALAGKLKWCADLALKTNYFDDEQCEVFEWYGKCFLKHVLQDCTQKPGSNMPTTHSPTIG